ncbi:hypothetical protein DFJ74DRAFT_643599 [Hyaloraphidium curvatum]|nr:hypothetical protein DFJ74DRAFT_643599 [Hyaloraphidium curvatum]
MLPIWLLLALAACGGAAGAAIEPRQAAATTVLVVVSNRVVDVVDPLGVAHALFADTLFYVPIRDHISLAVADGVVLHDVFLFALSLADAVVVDPLILLFHLFISQVHLAHGVGDPHLVNPFVDLIDWQADHQLVHGFAEPHGDELNSDGFIDHLTFPHLVVPYSYAHCDHCNPDLDYSLTGAQGIALADNGTIYGVSYAGGDYELGPGCGDCGVVWRYVPGDTARIAAFFNDRDTGGYPQGRPVPGSDGAYYIPTQSGGRSGLGTVARYSPATGSISGFVSFNVSTGASPMGSVVRGPDGNMYGTTSFGGLYDGGSVFRAAQDGTLTILFHFGGPNVAERGGEPYGGLTLGADGLMYGTTYKGGRFDGGTLFRISPAGLLSTLAHFNASTGHRPVNYPLRLADGSVVGTCRQGGANNRGTAWILRPSGELAVLAHMQGDRGGTTGMVEAGGWLYYGGTSTSYSSGRIMRVKADGSTGAEIVLTFSWYEGYPAGNGEPELFGGQPVDGLVLGDDGLLYGVTSGSLTGATGTLFALDVGLRQSTSTSRTSATRTASTSVAPTATKSITATQSTASRTASRSQTATVPTSSRSATATRRSSTAAAPAMPSTTARSTTSRSASRSPSTTSTRSSSTSRTRTTTTTPPIIARVLHRFDWTAGSPIGIAQAPDGSFRGTSWVGGQDSWGTFFSLSAAGAYSTLFTFDGTTSNLVYASGPPSYSPQCQCFYGTTEGSEFYIGPDGETSFSADGTLYSVDLAGTVSVLARFSPRDERPSGALAIGPNGTVYGTLYTPAGDGGQVGKVYRYDPSSGTVSTVVDLAAAGLGAYPDGVTLGPDGRLYGAVAMLDDFEAAGYLYSVGTDGSGLLSGAVERNVGKPVLGAHGIVRWQPGSPVTTLFTFPSDGSYGCNPSAPLLRVGDDFFGTTQANIFRLRPPYTEVEVVVWAGGSALEAPFGGSMELLLPSEGGLVQASDGRIFGVSRAPWWASSEFYGAFFAIDLRLIPPPPPTARPNSVDVHTEHKDGLADTFAPCFGDGDFVHQFTVRFAYSDDNAAALDDCCAADVDATGGYEQQNGEQQQQDGKQRHPDGKHTQKGSSSIQTASSSIRTANSSTQKNGDQHCAAGRIVHNSAAGRVDNSRGAFVDELPAGFVDKDRAHQQSHSNEILHHGHEHHHAHADEHQPHADDEDGDHLDVEHLVHFHDILYEDDQPHHNSGTDYNPGTLPTAGSSCVERFGTATFKSVLNNVVIGCKSYNVIFRQNLGGADGRAAFNDYFGSSANVSLPFSTARQAYDAIEAINSALAGRADVDASPAPDALVNGAMVPFAPTDTSFSFRIFRPGTTAPNRPVTSPDDSIKMERTTGYALAMTTFELLDGSCVPQEGGTIAQPGGSTTTSASSTRVPASRTSTSTTSRTMTTQTPNVAPGMRSYCDRTYFEGPGTLSSGEGTLYLRNVTVPPGGTVANVSVSLTYSHEYGAEATLSHPDGTGNRVLTLQGLSCNLGDQVTQFTFRDDAASYPGDIEGGTCESKTVKPWDPFRVYRGKGAAGTWTLAFRPSNTYPPQVFRFYEWCLWLYTE